MSARPEDPSKIPETTSVPKPDGPSDHAPDSAPVQNNQGKASEKGPGLPPFRHGQEPALRTLAMPADTNPNGDIFGGWLLAQMDIAGSVIAYERAGGRVATIAIDAMTFMQPVFVGDLVSCYAALEGEGRTSMRIKVDTFARRRGSDELVQVTQGSFTYVAIGDDRRPRPLPVREK